MLSCLSACARISPTSVLLRSPTLPCRWSNSHTKGGGAWVPVQVAEALWPQHTQRLSQLAHPESWAVYCDGTVLPLAVLERVSPEHRQARIYATFAAAYRAAHPRPPVCCFWCGGTLAGRQAWQLADLYLLGAVDVARQRE